MRSPHRTDVVTLVVTAVVAALLTVAGGVTPAHASAAPTTAEAADDDAPAFVLGTRFEIDEPYRLPPTSTGHYRRFGIVVTPTRDVSDVQVTVSGPGLRFKGDNPEGQGDHQTLRQFAYDALVASEAPGFHTMTVTVSADGEEPVSLDADLLWGPGDAHIDGHDSLRGRLAGFTAFGPKQINPYGGSFDSRFSHRYAFVDARFARRSLRARGRCTASTRGCQRYYYDASTGLVQIGDDTIGRLSRRGLFVDDHHATRLTYPRAHTRMRGTWRFARSEREIQDPNGVLPERLVLRGNGTYDLRYSAGNFEYSDFYTVHTFGRYRILSHGRLVLNDQRKHRRRQVATLSVASRPGGKPQARRLGIALDVVLHYEDAPTVEDGNLMRLVP